MIQHQLSGLGRHITAGQDTQRRQCNLSRAAWSTHVTMGQMVGLADFHVDIDAESSPSDDTNHATSMNVYVQSHKTARQGSDEAGP